MATSPVLPDITGECVQHLPGTNRDLVTALRTGWQHLAQEALAWSQVLVSLLGELPYTCSELLAGIEASKTSVKSSFVSPNKEE